MMILSFFLNTIFETLFSLPTLKSCEIIPLIYFLLPPVACSESRPPAWPSPRPPGSCWPPAAPSWSEARAAAAPARPSPPGSHAAGLLASCWDRKCVI